MIIIFGNINIKAHDDKNLEKLISTENSIERTWSNTHSYYFNDLYKKFYPNLTNSYKEFTKSMLKYAKSSMNNKADNSSMNNKTDN